LSLKSSPLLIYLTGCIINEDLIPRIFCAWLLGRQSCALGKCETAGAGAAKDCSSLHSHHREDCSRKLL
jgi:hypothetical protein